MNVLQVTTTTVYPPDKGSHDRSHGLVISYANDGDEVKRFAQGGLLSNHSFPDIEREIEMGDRMTELRPLNPLYDLPSIPPAVFGTPGVAAGPVLRWVPSRRFRRLLAWADFVQVEMPYQVSAVAEMTPDTPVVYSSHNVESVRWPSIHGDDSYRVRWSTRQIARIEQQAVRAADLVVCTSTYDEQRLREVYTFETPTVVAPNGVFADSVTDCTEVDDRAYRESRSIDGETTLAVFVGSDYEPNVEAVEQILPVLSSTTEDVHLSLVGTVCNHFSAPELPPNVTLEGFVDDLDAVLCAADVGLNPVTSGGGTNIKLLDYVARELPVLSTPFGVRGFEFGSADPVVTGSVEEFDELLSELDEERRRQLSENAKAYAREHTWERISESLKRDIREIVGLTEADGAGRR